MRPMRVSLPKVNIFEFQDYRAYLTAWYQLAKKSRASYSYRLFAKKAGFSSSNFLMLVMTGRRNLTEESLNKFVVGLDLNKQEGDFFRNLVFFNQSKTHDEKNLYYQRLLQSRKFSQLKPIEKRQYEYYSTWYHPVIRELAVSPDFDGTPEWLAEKIFPPIYPSQAAKSIELLEELGFIEKGGTGKWKQVSSVISTGPDLSSIVVHNYHKSLLDLTKEVMDKLPLTERDISTMTLGVKKERIPQLKKKIREFRQEVLKLVSTDINPEEVTQLSIQFYPLTRSINENKIKRVSP